MPPRSLFASEFWWARWLPWQPDLWSSQGLTAWFRQTPRTEKLKGKINNSALEGVIGNGHHHIFQLGHWAIPEGQRKPSEVDCTQSLSFLVQSPNYLEKRKGLRAVYKRGRGGAWEKHTVGGEEGCWEKGWGGKGGGRQQGRDFNERPNLTFPGLKKILESPNL